MKLSFINGTLTAVAENEKESIKLMETLVTEGYSIGGVIKRSYTIKGNGGSAQYVSPQSELQRGKKHVFDPAMRERILNLNPGHSFLVRDGEWKFNLRPTVYVSVLSTQLAKRNEFRKYQTRTLGEGVQITRVN